MHGDAHERDAKLLYQLEMIVFLLEVISNLMKLLHSTRWSRGSTVSNTMHETGHSSTTVVDWYNFHRDVCAQYFIDHPVKGGGIKIVEVNESKFWRREYNRGRYQDGHWVFGGVY